MNKQRQEAENIVYKVFDAIDKTGQNSGFYKEKFAKMTDAQFLTFCKQDFAFKFQTKIFEIEPTFQDIKKGADILKIPLIEKINMPFIYMNKDGVPVKSKEALVVYVPLKKMKQFLTKKNSMSTDISMRDMKTGLLLNADKNGATSDREMESLAVMSLGKTMDELSRYRADAMNAKSQFYNDINTKGMVYLKDIPVDIDDSLAKNLLNVYLLGSLLNSNLMNEEDYLQYTLKDKKRKVERET